MHAEPYYREVPLVGRKGVVRGVMIVDADVYDRLATEQWVLDSAGYARRYIRVEGRIRGVLAHREVLGLTYGDGKQTDHINRDRLDNRRVNLRLVTHAENMQNRKSYRGSKSRFRGVYWAKDKNQWRARMRLDGVSYHVGYFDTEEEAGRAVNAFRLEHMPFAQPDITLDS